MQDTSNTEGEVSTRMLNTNLNLVNSGGLIGRVNVKSRNWEHRLEL